MEKIELNIFQPVWINFCSGNFRNSRELTLNNVNKSLSVYDAYVTDLGEWRVFFKSQQGYTMFLLKWM